jgi:hypothetical protein
MLHGDTTKIYQFYMKHFYMLIVTNIATLRLFGVVSDKCNIMEICRSASVNCTQKVIIELYNY